VTGIPFVTLDDPRYGEVVEVAPLVRRVTAENPSKFTYRGTGTYIIGEGVVAVVDPGPKLDAHREALEQALAGKHVGAVLVTHCHSDHSPLSAWVQQTTGAPTVAAGPHGPLVDWDAEDDDGIEVPPTGEPGDRQPKMEEAIDTAFKPDVFVGDGDVAAAGDGWEVEAVRTPGHTSNHTCYALRVGGAPAGLFTGDHIMGWSTTVITPPDGSMTAYLDSLRKVAARHEPVFYPTHGSPVTDTGPFLKTFLAHRLDRESNVLRAIGEGRTAIKDIVADLYADVRIELHKAAARSVLAHLIKLVDEGRVAVAGGGPPKLGATYLLV